MTALRAFAELNEAGTRINVHFKYDPEAVAAIRRVPGRHFSQAKLGKAAFWDIPLDFTAAQRLREEFGQGLVLGDAVNAWGKAELRKRRNLAKIANASDATLERIDAEAAAWLRPYQRADIAMMAAVNVLNANQPGTGKTVEVIFAVKEAGLNGLHVVIAPLTLHKDPWADELAAHAPDDLVFWAETPEARRESMRDALAAVANGAENVWLIINPDMIRAEGDKNLSDEEAATKFAGRRYFSKDHKGNAYYPKPEVAALFDVDIASLTLDEFHKFGLGENRNTLFARAVDALGKKAAKRFALSGTPMGGKPIRLWGVLYFIEPTLYGSKWRWAEEWLMNADGSGPVEAGAGTGIGDIIPGREEAFYVAHAKHMVRRTRKDALPGLPDKVVIPVDVGMTKKQEKVYLEFERAAEAAVEGGRISGNGILSEFARLKQLANARCEVVDGEVVPTTDSGKLPVLIERLDGFGLRKDNPEPGARAIVASESKRFIKVVADVLAAEGLNVKLLTGEITGAKRTAVIDWYKEDVKEARLLVMTTQTGGVGLNLGMTGSIHILDETWNPDDQEQLEDRGMRNRTTPLMVLYYRTRATIQEYIAQIGYDKKVNNANVLDVVRAARQAKAAA